MILEKSKIKRLKEIAKQTRLDIINMIFTARSGNPGGSLSCVEIIVVLYYHVMNLHPKNSNWAKRDRFILSKGHACPALYSILSQKGYIDKSELSTFRQFGTICPTHPELGKTKGIDFSTGSLGTGLSVGVGMALGFKYLGLNNKVFVLIGDGELQEGQNWEAALTAAQYKLDNLIAIVDYNKIQQNGTIDQTISLKPLNKKWLAFGWKVKTVNGHNITDLIKIFHSLDEINNKPKVIIANTIKGKGISYMENSVKWHIGANMTEEEKETALREIKKIKI